MLHTVIREERTSFDPETISAIAEAYDAVLRELSLSEHDDAGTRMVAKQVIEFASQGERNAKRLNNACNAERSGLSFDIVPCRQRKQPS
jgi:hypothetical protein